MGECEINKSPVLLRMFNNFCHGFNFLEVPGQWMFQFLPFLADCGLDIRNFHCLFDSDGWWNSDTYPFSEMWSMCFCGLPRSLRLCWRSLLLVSANIPLREHTALKEPLIFLNFFELRRSP